MDVGRIHVRLYGDLRDLAPEVRPREPEVAVPAARSRSVKDLIESLGVPHTELALLLVNGEPADFAVQVGPGDRVAAYPPSQNLDPDEVDGARRLRPEPPDPRRFVLDVHLGTLARRLRLLGFDAWWRNDADDDELARLAADDQRILLTRDRKLLMRRVVVWGHCPRSPVPDEQLDAVARRFGLAERARPWTRCIVCNGVLVAVDKAAVLDALPPRTRVEHDRFSRCEDCRQVFWPGSHVDAMAGVLERVRAIAP